MVGIDISDRSIKIAELSDELQPHLKTVGWQPISDELMRRGVVTNVPALTAALQSATANCSQPLDGNLVVASIPEFQSFVRVLEVPAMSAGEMDEAVQWAIRQHIPFDPGRVYIDWQPLLTAARSARHQQVLVGATRRDVVDPLLAVFDAAGFEVVALELEAQAVVRSLLPRQAADVRGVLIIDIGATSTNVVFFDQGTMRFTTSIALGGDRFTQSLMQQLQMTAAAADEKKALVGVQDGSADPAAVAALREAVLGLVREIERAVRQIMVVQEASSEGIRAILLSGGSANMPGLGVVFQEVFPGVPVQLGNPWTNLAAIDEKKSVTLSKADMLHFTTAFGLALRQAGGENYA